MFRGIRESIRNYQTNMYKILRMDIKDVILPERTPEEKEESWNRLHERIKKEYGDNLTYE